MTTTYLPRPATPSAISEENESIFLRDWLQGLRPHSVFRLGQSARRLTARLHRLWVLSGMLEHSQDKQTLTLSPARDLRLNPGRYLMLNCDEEFDNDTSAHSDWIDEGRAAEVRSSTGCAGCRKSA